jgi:phosphate transport system permease protein
MTSTAKRLNATNALHRRRQMVNKIALGLSMIAMAIGLTWLVMILFTTIVKGVSGASWEVFTTSTGDGGLLNAIIGSGVIVLYATLIGTPIGLFAGIYLAEYGKKSRFAATVRFINDMLLSSPSIVVGLFVASMAYELVTDKSNALSGYAGACALALLIIPVVIRATENMLQLVPGAMREAAFALGAPKWKMICMISLPAAKEGVLTGVMLAVARICGETAPLLFTIKPNNSISDPWWNLADGVATLPVTINTLFESPDQQATAWVAVFLIALGVLGLNILARVLFRKK